MKREVYRILSLVLVLVLLTGVTACGGSTGSQTDGNTNPGSSSTGSSSSPPSSSGSGGSTSGSSSYESGGAPGTSEEIANALAESDAARTALYERLGIIEQSLLTADPNRKGTHNTNERLPFLRFAWGFSASELMPETYDNSGHFMMHNAYFEQLIDKVGMGEYAPRLAKEFYWEDDLNYIVKLYDYIYDSDGNHFTAHDVVFTYDKKIERRMLQNASFLKSYEAVDDYTVRFTFAKEPDLVAFDDIVRKMYMVTEKAYTENDMAVKPVGTGPYRLVEFVPGGYGVLEARDDYWQTEALRSPLARANVQRFQVDFVTDSSQRILAMQNNTSDLLLLDKDAIPIFTGSGQYADSVNVCYYWDANPIEIMVNLYPNKITSDPNFRRAMWYALDSEGFVQVLGPELWRAMTCNVANTHPDYQPEWDSWQSYITEYDLNLAKDYLAKTAYKGETIIIFLEDNVNFRAIGVTLQGMLSAVGIKSELLVMNKGLMTSTYIEPDQWDIALMSSTMAGTGDEAVVRLYNLYSIEKGVAEGYPYNFADDPGFQAKLTECMTKSGYSVENTEELLKYIIENAWSYPIVNQGYITAYKKIFANTNGRKYGNYRHMPTASDFYLD